jgi:peptidylprolyl isomerase
MLRRLTLALPLALALLAAGCSDDSTSPSYADPATATYASELGIDLGAMTRTETGLYVGEVTVGTGALVEIGRRVSVQYTGWLIDGTQFDTSRDDNVPLAWNFGVERLIPGFEQGVNGMRVGGRRKLVIPPQLAYGLRANGPIPANSILVFDVEVVGVQ